MSPEKYDLTLDVCVLITGSGNSDPDTCKTYGYDCFQLMKKMVDSDQYYLALDDRNKIKQQYDDKLGPSYGKYFVKAMAGKDKTITIPWKDLNRGIKVKLAENGFTQDSDDYKYVVVAAGTCCGQLISHERHFFNVKGILRKLNILTLLPHQV